MDTPENVLAAIYRAVDWINAELPHRQLNKTRDTRLLGPQSVLDSLHLVSLLINIEREMEDSLGIALTLANERALSMNESPFRTECERGIAPIGKPFDGMQALIVDEQLREVEQGTEGELLMSGPQLSVGYWQDERKTREMFVSVPSKSDIYYKTGDRVVRGSGPDKPLLYLGREIVRSKCSDIASR